MIRRGWLAAGLFALPAVAAEPPPAPLDPEFLEFLAETAGEDEEFAKYVESRRFERELEETEEQRAAAKDEDHEP
ncbi:MAG: hypothetical protein ACRER4_04430 [Steroidobacteraceae bacterium]